MIARDPETGELRRVAYYIREDGTEVLVEVPPDKYDVEAMSPRQLEMRATFSEVAASRFGKKGRINEYVGEGTRREMKNDPTPRRTKRDKRRAELRALVGEQGLKAAREVGPGRSRAKVLVSGAPRLLKSFDEIPIPEF